MVKWDILIKEVVIKKIDKVKFPFIHQKEVVIESMILDKIE